MSEGVLIFAAVVAGILLGSLLVIFGVVILDRCQDKAWEDERPTWADDPTPLFDALMCEQIERAEGWIK